MRERAKLRSHKQVIIKQVGRVLVAGFALIS